MKVCSEVRGSHSFEKEGCEEIHERFHVGHRRLNNGGCMYLWCVVDVTCQVRMVEETSIKVVMLCKGTGDWLRRCRATVGEVKGATFVKLLEMLVESVCYMGYQAYPGGQLDAVENVRCGQQESFYVGRRHPLISLQFEMDMYPVKWEALRRLLSIWVQLMRRMIIFSESGNAGSLGGWK